MAIIAHAEATAALIIATSFFSCRQLAVAVNTDADTIATTLAFPTPTPIVTMQPYVPNCSCHRLIVALLPQRSCPSPLHRKTSPNGCSSCWYDLLHDDNCQPMLPPLPGHTVSLCPCETAPAITRLQSLLTAM